MDSPEMKAFMEYMTPGEMHKLLAKFDGDWDTKTRFWMTPESPAEISTGDPIKTRSVYTYIDDNHWSMEMFNMMDGKEFKSMHTDYVKSK